MSQLATSMSALTNEPGRLPSQTVQNPKANISMIKMSDMKEALEEAAYWENKILDTMKREGKKEKDSEYPGILKKMTKALGPEALGTTWPSLGLGTEKIRAQDSSYSMKIIASEDHATQKNKVEKGLEPRNEKNALMTERLLTWNHEAQLEMGKDPGAFTVTCGIGKAQIHHCLIDLGAAVNVLPYPLYCSLGLGPLKPPRLFIELGDKSCIHPVGVLENLMLRVGKLVVPADFYIIQTGDTSEDDPPTLILGWPFLYTTRAKIDISEGLLSLVFGGRISNFRTSTKKPPDIVNTADLSALVSDQQRETESMTKPAAMVKKSLPTWKNRKAKPPEQWRPDPRTSFHESSGRNETRAAAKFDLSRPWDPNL
ncbi:unnamed protein product [Rhodiola kirilowii]